MNSLCSGFVPLTIICLVIGFAILMTWLTHRRSVSMIESWAMNNGLQLVSASRCWITLGTPFWLAGKDRTVYTITAQDGAGNLLSGYALCGGFFLGLWSDRVEVKWDREPVEKWKNDDLDKPKNDFIKRKNEW